MVQAACGEGGLRLGPVGPDVTVPDEAARLLEGTTHAAFLATCTDGRPHVAPLWYRYLPDEEVVEVSTTGKKLANLRANPRVSLAVHEAEAGHPEWRVTLFGTATVVEDEDAFQRANRAINRKYGADPDDWSENTLVRIHVGSASVETF